MDSYKEVVLAGMGDGGLCSIQREASMCQSCELSVAIANSRNKHSKSTECSMGWGDDLSGNYTDRV